ncbi:MAG: site-2 protease family protein [Deltaproteobacteria bacterium]|nr:MAG: site-2 protease family protein [Deltaproteobacteria bacterium]
MGLIDKPDPERRERWVAGGLFFSTCCTVFLVYAIGWQGEAPLELAGRRALLFTLSLMGILLLHELGHVALAMRHGFRIGWPWFLPFPLFIGTLGAVIRLREIPRTRTGLLEMGAAGPLAGLGVVVGVIGLRVFLGPLHLADESVALATPLIFHLVHLSLFQGLAPPVSVLDPLGFAAWIGCLVTAMNLLPLGQLDGGHVVSALLPTWTRWIGWVVTIALLLGGLLWPGWAVWAVALHLMGARHAVPVRDPTVPPDSRARWVALGALVAFVLTFTPVPLRFSG